MKSATLLTTRPGQLWLAMLLLAPGATAAHAQTPTDSIAILRVAIEFLKPRQASPDLRIVLDPRERPTDPRDSTHTRPPAQTTDLAERIGAKVASDSERISCTPACRPLPANTLLLWVNQPQVKGDSATIEVGRASTTSGPPCPGGAPPPPSPGAPKPSCGVMLNQLGYRLTIVRTDNIWRVTKVAAMTN